MATLILDRDDYAALGGLELGQELDLELTAVVTAIQPELALVAFPVASEGGSPSSQAEAATAALTVIRLDVTQTT